MIKMESATPQQTGHDEIDIVAQLDDLREQLKYLQEKTDIIDPLEAIDGIYDFAKSIQKQVEELQENSPRSKSDPQAYIIHRRLIRYRGKRYERALIVLDYVAATGKTVFRNKDVSEIIGAHREDRETPRRTMKAFIDLCHGGAIRAACLVDRDQDGMYFTIILDGIEDE